MGLNSSAGGFDIYQYFMAVEFEAGGHVPARLLNAHDAIVSKHACDYRFRRGKPSGGAKRQQARTGRSIAEHRLVSSSIDRTDRIRTGDR
jgi:hypothetical protein